MACLSFTDVVAGFASAVHTFLFGKDDKPRPSTTSSSRSSGTTRPPHQPSPSSYTRGSYARNQTADWIPLTSDYGRSFYDSKHTSPHAGASARSQAFHQPPTAPSRSQTTVGTTATAAHNHRVFPSPAVQSHQPASTSAHAQASYQRSPSPDPDHRFSGSSLTPSPAVQSRQPAPTSTHTQTSYQRSPSPDPAHIFGLYQSSLAQPRTPCSPPAYLQAATDADGSLLTHVVQPSPVPADLSDSESDEIEYVEDDDIAKELRDRAQRQHREMRNARARAKDAHKKGDNVAERRNKQEATARKNAMDQLNAKAAKIIFHQKNKGSKKGTADLHGLQVQEAIQYAKQELQSASWREGAVVRFIVGKGKHAKDGQAKIRPALEELCNERGLIHSLDPRNAGVLIVQLD